MTYFNYKEYKLAIGNDDMIECLYDGNFSIRITDDEVIKCRGNIMENGSAYTLSDNIEAWASNFILTEHSKYLDDRYRAYSKNKDYVLKLTYEDDDIVLKVCMKSTVEVIKLPYILAYNLYYGNACANVLLRNILLGKRVVEEDLIW